MNHKVVTWHGIPKQGGEIKRKQTLSRNSLYQECLFAALIPRSRPCESFARVGAFRRLLVNISHRHSRSMTGEIAMTTVPGVTAFDRRSCSSPPSCQGSSPPPTLTPGHCQAVSISPPPRWALDPLSLPPPLSRLFQVRRSAPPPPLGSRRTRTWRPLRPLPISSRIHRTGRSVESPTLPPFPSPSLEPGPWPAPAATVQVSPSNLNPNPETLSVETHQT